MTASAFDLLSTGIQRWLYQQRWSELRPIQVDAIRCVLQTSNDCLVAARTASGKTEAAFLPILSSISNDPMSSVRAMYVGPLRALINDQFRRMDLLCQDLGVPVNKWHGDVGAGARNAFLRSPSGVLLITPESLEGFFVRRSSLLGKLFSHLQFVVIDELHAFPGTERGMHLRSLLHRLQRKSDLPIRRIGLSATLGDLTLYQHWLRPSRPEQVTIIHSTQEGAELKTKCYAFPVPTAPHCDWEDGGGDGSNSCASLYASMLKHHREGTNLVFGNSKREIEDCVIGLQREARNFQYPVDHILVHHGSISREIREDAERVLQSGEPCVCCCSSTLELGVDIGSVRAIAHLSAPMSVASMAQRLGRSGRRPGEASVFRQYHKIHNLDGCSDHDEERLHPGLIRGIALLRLFLNGWCESARIGLRHWSTFVHQIISVIAQDGGATAQSLYERLVGGDGFPDMSTAEFAHVLRYLATQNMLEQISDGTILLGKNAEIELNDKGWYAAFNASDTYTVKTQTQSIGSITVDNAYKLGDGFRLAGRGWEVIDVDDERLTILVQPSNRRNLPKFSGMAGIVHDCVIGAMRTLLEESSQIPFLDEQASEGLAAARKTFRRIGLDSHFMTTSDNGVTIWPWKGSRVLQTLSWALRASGLEVQVGHLSLTISDVDVETVTSALISASGDLRNVILRTLQATKPELLWRERFDCMLPADLILESVLNETTDIETTSITIRDIVTVEKHT